MTGVCVGYLPQQADQQGQQQDACQDSDEDDPPGDPVLVGHARLRIDHDRNLTETKGSY